MLKHKLHNYGTLFQMYSCRVRDVCRYVLNISFLVYKFHSTFFFLFYINCLVSFSRQNSKVKNENMKHCDNARDEGCCVVWSEFVTEHVWQIECLQL